MIILLLTLLGVALVITFAGLLLSAHKVAPEPPPEVFYTGRTIKARQRERAYAVRSEMIRGTSVNRTSRERIYSLEDERRPWFSGLASLNVSGVFGLRTAKQTPWLGILLILLAIFGFCCFTLNSLLLHPGLVFNASLPDAATTATAAAAPGSKPAATSPFIGLSGASKALQRVYQLDPAQYGSPQDYDKWAYSACSAASMTEVINSYGHNYRIADILKVEAGLGEITPDQGLMEPTGIDRTVAQFGFTVVHLTDHPLDEIVSVANQGRPVIVGFPPSRWEGGHLLVLRGGDSQSVYLADSSRLNMQVMQRSVFMKYWGGFAVVATPK